MKNRFTEQQITFASRQAASGMPVAKITRKMGLSEQMFYRWKKQFTRLEGSEIYHLKEPEEDGRRLKHFVAILTLDDQMLQEVLSEEAEICHTQRTGNGDEGNVP